MIWWLVIAADWAQWRRTPSQSSFSAPVRRSLVSQWFCEILPPARQWLKSTRRRDFAPLGSIENIYWRPALWVHAWISLVCTFVGVSIFMASGWKNQLALSWALQPGNIELGRHSRAAALLFLPRRKKSQAFLQLKVSWPCDGNFYLNPENRAGLILNSQETAAEGGASRH